MESKIKVSQRRCWLPPRMNGLGSSTPDYMIRNYWSNDLCKMGTLPKSKVKDKARKELWDSLLAVYENEKQAKASVRLDEKEFEEISNVVSHLPNITKNILKLRKKRKSRHHRNSQVMSNNDNTDVDFNAVIENGKEKKKLRESQDPKETFKSSIVNSFQKDKTKNIPPIIVLHQYKKNFDNLNDNEHFETTKYQSCFNPDKNQKHKNLHTPDTHEKIFTVTSVNSQNEMEPKDKKSNIIHKNSKDKLKKKKTDKGVVYKTLSTNIEAKLRKKKRKLEKQQILKEVATTLGKSDEIYDQIKNLPIKINENQLIFMHPSHLTKALGHCLQRNRTLNHANDELNFKMLSSNNNSDKNEQITQSALKLVKNKHSSTKRLRVLSSVKKVKKPKSSYLEEISDKSSRKDCRKTKGDRKIRKKFTTTEIHKGVEDSHSAKKISRGSHKYKICKPLMKTENHTYKLPSVLEQNVCYGDNGIDSFTNTIYSQDKIHNTNDKSLNMELAEKELVSVLKQHPCEHKIQNNSIEEKQTMERKDRKGSFCNPDNICENENKLSISEDEKKLTFQLVKANMNSRRYKRLRKNVYSVSDRRTLGTSRESSQPSLQNNRLYITKRMLFYADKESSGASKESLNIAISRDTEISKNGSSNNVLNVVIKQTKNSATSSKIILSPKIDCNKQSIENCDNKATEEIDAKNDRKMEMGNTVNFNNSKNIEKIKHLKEAECQTEDNTDFLNKAKNEEYDPTHPECQNDDHSTQNEFKNFYVYHFQNYNAKVNKDIEMNHDNKNEFLHKPLIPPDTKANTVSFLDHDAASNNFKYTKTVDFDKQYRSRNPSKVKDDFRDCSEKIKSNFYTVVDINDYDLSQNIFDRSKDNSNALYRFNYKKTTQHELSNKKENTNLNFIMTAIPSDEMICSKLKNIGLTDKRSFVRVIRSKPSIDKPSHNQLRCNNKISGDVVYCSLENPQKEINIIMSDDVNNHNFTNFNYLSLINNKIYSNQMENSKNKLTLIQNDSLNKKFVNQDQQKHIKKDNKILDSYINEPNLNTFIGKKKDNCNGFQACLESSNLKVKKENFINVLPEHSGKMKNNEPNTKNLKAPARELEIKRKVSSKITKKFAVSEIGVQTDISDLVPTIPYKSVSSVRKNNSSILLRNALGFKSLPGEFDNDEHDFKIVDKVQNTNLRTLPLKKNSFVHILKSSSEKNSVNKFLNNHTYIGSQKVQAEFSQNLTDSEVDKQINIIKNFQEEQQIVYKINAIYDFLQYLDKILKENSILKQDTNFKSCTLGQFNSTLRCLCNNCLEILKKIELKQDKAKTLSNPKKISESDYSTQSLDKKSLFETTMNRLRNKKNSKSSLDVQCMNLNEKGNNDCDYNFSKVSNKMSPRPFYVVLSTDDKANKHFGNNCLNLESGQHLSLDKELNYKLFSNEFKSNHEGNCNEILLREEINKWRIEQKEGDCDEMLLKKSESLKHGINYVKRRLAKEIPNKLCDTFFSLEEKLAWQKKIDMRKDNLRNSRECTSQKVQSQENNIFVKHQNIANNAISNRTHKNLKVNHSSDLSSGNVNDTEFKKEPNLYCSIFRHSRSCIDSSETGDSESLQKTTSYKNHACDCCVSKVSSDSVMSNHQTENTCKEINRTQNHKSLQDNEICSSCLKDICMCYCPKNTKLITHNQKSKCSSLFSHLTSKNPFKKETWAGKRNSRNDEKIIDVNTVNTNNNSHYKKYSDTKETINETKVEVSHNGRSQQLSGSSVKNNTLHFNKKLDSYSYSNTFHPDGNDCAKNKNSNNNLNLKHSKQIQIHAVKEFCSESSLHSIKKKSRIFLTSNLSPVKNIFQETVNSLDENYQQDLEHKNSLGYESDGWVSLNDNLTEIENNQVRLDMNICEMPLRRVEYLQKFPDISEK